MPARRPFPARCLPWLAAAGLLGAPLARADGAYQALPHTWTNSSTRVVTADNDWSPIPGMIGYRGTGLVATEGVDPRTVLADPADATPSVECCMSMPWSGVAGVAQFKPYLPARYPSGIIGLAGAGSLVQHLAPSVVFAVDARHRYDLHVRFTLHDLDSLASDAANAVEPFALQYRLGGAGAWTDVPAAYVADATSGPGQPRTLTRRDVALPADADDALVQLRLITTDSPGPDEWVGVDSLTVDAAAFAGVVHPHALEFATPAGFDPPAQPVRFVDTGTGGPGTLEWTVTPSAAWLVPAPASGTLAAGDSAAVAVSVDAASLPVGTYAGVLRFAVTGNADAPLDSVTVQLVVGPESAVEPAAITFAVPRHGADSTTLVIRDLDPHATVSLAWQATDRSPPDTGPDCTWLAEAPASGTVAPADTQAVHVVAAAGALALGGYTAGLRIATNDPRRPVVTVPVTLDVEGARAGADPASLSFAVTPTSPDTMSAVVTIRNDGYHTALAWSLDVAADAVAARAGVHAAAACDGLTADAVTGSVAAGASTTVVVTAHGTGLAYGTYTCDLHVATNDVDTPTIAIPVTLRVMETVDVPAAPHAVAFRLEPPRPAPARSAATVAFTLPRDGRVGIAVYDIRGARVRSIADRTFAAGRHELSLALDGLPSGIYMIRAEASGTVATRRLLVTR